MSLVQSVPYHRLHQTYISSYTSSYVTWMWFQGSGSGVGDISGISLHVLHVVNPKGHWKSFIISEIHYKSDASSQQTIAWIIFIHLLHAEMPSKSVLYNKFLLHAGTYVCMYTNKYYICTAPRTNSNIKFNAVLNLRRRVNWRWMLTTSSLWTAKWIIWAHDYVRMSLDADVHT